MTLIELAGTRSTNAMPRGAGSYRFVGRLGAGGMAEVFLAVQEGPSSFRKLIAVKVLRPQFAEQSDGREMFLNEARLAARLNHPNVVNVLEVGEDGGRLFIAMEFLNGQPLSNILRRGREPKHETPHLTILLRILSDALSGVHHAHECQDYDGTPLGLVHRDLTPHNIFVTYGGAVKVLDFGIAKATSNTSETRAGVIKGKIPFLAPEQLNIEERVDKRVDVYAMGCCLWEALAGRPPFAGMNNIAILGRIVTRGVPPIREAVPELPEELERICMKAVARERSDRYGDALAFQSDLDAYAASLGVPVGMQQIGKCVADLFKDEAQQAQRLVEAAHRGSTGICAEGLESTNESGPHRSTDSGAGPSGVQETLGSDSIVVCFPEDEEPSASPPPRPLKAAVVLCLAASLVTASAALVFGAVRSSSTQAFPPAASASEGTMVLSRGRSVVRAEAPGNLDGSVEISTGADRDSVIRLESLPEPQASRTQSAGKSSRKLNPPGALRASGDHLPVSNRTEPVGAGTTPAAAAESKGNPQRPLDDVNPFDRSGTEQK